MEKACIVIQLEGRGLKSTHNHINVQMRSGPQELTWILALWLGIPEDKEINTVKQENEEIRSACELNIL